MSDDITTLLAQYAGVEPRRAAGGIYAMAGFAFQAHVYVAELVEALCGSGNELHEKGDVFVEALSDIAKLDDSQRLILLQVKRTLTRTTLDSAAGEIASIESFIASTRPDLKGAFRYGVVFEFTAGAARWDDLPKGSAQSDLIQALASEGRLVAPRAEPDPRWRAVAAAWTHIDDPYGFVRFAFERVLHRRIESDDARACRDEIAERFVSSRRTGRRVGLMLSTADFIHDEPAQKIRLEVGRQATLARLRAGQYMPRDQRVAVLAERAAALSDLSMLSPEAAIRVLWLSGRSGAGKSVLLIQLLRHLVLQGRRVLWLGGDAGLLDQALRGLEGLPAGEGPEYIAVDDLYDRDAREHLELAALAGYIDEQGRRTWPLIITCGPTEFADAFVDATRFRGFEVTAAPVNPLGSDEAADFLGWARVACGVSASEHGEAIVQAQQGQGLFVSIASELEFGDLREFGARFCARVSAASLRDPLRPLLALNRLYLRAPLRWLSMVEREALEAINREGDFSLLEVVPGNPLVRLTHPHLSDAIYRALLKPPTPWAFANDLATAFERAVDEGDDQLYARLLRTFSASDRSLVADRLVDADMTALAARCVSKWRSLPTGGDRRVQADAAVSWACWRAAHANLGSSEAELIDIALGSLDAWPDSDPRQSYWPAYWWRLWQAAPQSESLRIWANQRITSEGGLRLPQWSRIWEALVDIDSDLSRLGLAPALADAAKRWLALSHERPDWHFVWKKLPKREATDILTARDLALAELERPSAPSWAFVFEDILEVRTEFLDEDELHALVAQGCAWLAGREDRAEWAYVWKALLERPQLLPVGVDEATLVAQGCVWLAGREDRAEWTHLWRALLERPQLLPVEVGEATLVARGCAWLAGREDRAEWTHVWKALLARTQLLPEDVKETALVAQGCAWLAGREDRAEWNYVWQALLARTQLLPADVNESALVARGCAWLAGREDRAEWTHVWVALLARTQLLPADVNESALVARGCAWLAGREDRAEWTHVWEALLARTQLLPADVSESALVARGCAWLAGREDRAEWAHVWQALLARTKLLPAETNESALVAQGCDWLAGREERAEWTHVWEALLARTQLLPEDVKETALVAQGCAWLAGREDRSDRFPVLKKLLEKAALLTKEESSRVQAQTQKLLEHPLDLSHGALGHLVESMLDAGVAGEAVMRAAFNWLRADPLHRAWPLVAGKYLLRASGDERSHAIAGLLVDAIQRHPNAGAWYRLQCLLDGIDTETSTALALVQSTLLQRTTLPAWKAVGDKLASGEPMDASVTKQDRKGVMIELDGGLFAVLEVTDGFRYPPGRRLQVVITEVAIRSDRVSAAPWEQAAAPAQSAALVPGCDYEGIVSGHKPYGIFVRVHGHSGLVHAKYLTNVPSFSTRYPKGSTIEVQLIEIGPRGLVLALPPKP
jgi:hypothetical protein